jgi:1,4-dihydroxy-2-naphthoyl-CoA hydrolase
MDIAVLQERLNRLYPGHLGITVLEASADGLRAELNLREELCTLPGTVHGGALMGFADTLGAVCTVLNLPPGASGTTTIESKTNFFRRADVSGKVVGECTALHKGRTTMVWQTRITDADGKLVALTTQTQMVLQG